MRRMEGGFEIRLAPAAMATWVKLTARTQKALMRRLERIAGLLDLREWAHSADRYHQVTTPRWSIEYEVDASTRQLRVLAIAPR